MRVVLRRATQCSFAELHAELYAVLLRRVATRSYAVLRRATLSYTELHEAMKCYAVLRCAMLCYAVPR